MPDLCRASLLHQLLTTALSSRMTPERKTEILEDTYGIPMSHEWKEAAARMCNLADLVEERGIEKGIETERDHGMQILIESCKEFGQTMETAIKKLMEKYLLSAEDAQVLVWQYWPAA